MASLLTNRWLWIGIAFIALAGICTIQYYSIEAKKAEIKQLQQAKAIQDETIMTLTAYQEIMKAQTEKQLKAKDSTIANIRRICETPKPAGGECGKALDDSVTSELNSLWNNSKPVEMPKSNNPR